MEFKSLFILCRCSSNATCSRNCSMSTFMQLFLTGCVSRTHCCWILRSFSFRLCFARRKLKYSLNEFMLKTIIMQINSFFLSLEKETFVSCILRRPFLSPFVSLAGAITAQLKLTLGKKSELPCLFSVWEKSLRKLQEPSKFIFNSPKYLWGVLFRQWPPYRFPRLGRNWNFW